MRKIETDCLIIGCGVAGLSAAIALAKRGVNCTLISSGEDETTTNSWHAQGGIIYKASEADAHQLFEDIMNAGCGMNYRPAVEQLVDLGPKLVEEVLLDLTHTDFDKNEKGELSLTREGAHSESRILHHGDQTGQSIQSALMEYVATQEKIDILPRTTAVNLLMSSFHASDMSIRHGTAYSFGAFVFDQSENEVYPIFAKETIIATGGVGQLYLNNTNSKYSRGDGIALAYRAGCRLENLEYIQFHPTTFFHSSSRRFLISEALRGEGAVLRNHANERFLKKWLPDLEIPELAPRDRLAQAIHHELLSTGANNVYLDISHKSSEWIKERFPFIYQSCLKYGVDMTEQPIPVVPAAHYHCGGVWTDLVGRTSVANLWAVGETACTGLHGANRLASTSLLEGLVWGTRCGEEIARKLKLCDVRPYPGIEKWEYETTEVDTSFFAQDWLTLKSTMWNYVGMIKTDARHKRAEGILGELSRGIDVFYRKAVLSDTLIGLRHAVTVAQLILEASKRNQASLGCYLRAELEI